MIIWKKLTNNYNDDEDDNDGDKDDSNKPFLFEHSHWNLLPNLSEDNSETPIEWSL